MSPTRNNERVDIAVVGGGISGLYCCLQLARRIRQGGNLWIGGKPVAANQVTLGFYERSEALGGRIETWSIDARNLGAGRSGGGEQFHAEFGPMRIEPRHQPLLKNLLDYLDITELQPPESGKALVSFPAYSAEDPAEVKFKLEGEEGEQRSLLDLLLLAIRRICELVVEDGQHVPWHRAPAPGGDEQPAPGNQAARYWHQFLGVSSVRRRYWKGELRDWINNLTDSDYDFIRKNLSLNGVRLCDMGFWNLLSEVLSHLAVLRIRDWGSYYHLIGENPNAAEHLIMWLRALRSTNSLRGVSGGMSRIVKELEDKAAGYGIQPRYRHTLVRLERSERGGPLRLHFENQPPVEAAHVILALPQRPLEKLQFHPVHPIRDELDSVIGVPLLKLFFIIDQPWWEDDRPANRYAGDLPTREMHYWKSKDKSKGMVMLYTDRPALQFWADYLDDAGRSPSESFQEKANCWFLKTPQACTEEDSENPRLWRRFVQYARDYEHNDFTVDRLLACGMRDWSRQPYGSAVHVWRPRRESWTVMKKLAAFSMGGEVNTIHVCGDAYSDYQGFIEGALRSAARVLDYFDRGAVAEDWEVDKFLERWGLAPAGVGGRA
jgi:hypothetical protein